MKPQKYVHPPYNPKTDAAYKELKPQLPFYQCRITESQSKKGLFYYKFVCPHCAKENTHGAGNGTRYKHCFKDTCPPEYNIWASPYDPLYDDREMGPSYIHKYQTNTMTTENNPDRPPLTSISTNGTYKLKLIRPKGTDKVKVWEDGTCSARLFFVDDKGFCLSKNFSSKYGKALAMLVGKFSGKFTEEIRLDATPAEYLQYISPACGQTILVGVECEPNGESNGRPQYKYKMTYPRGSQKPTATEALPDNPPF